MAIGVMRRGRFPLEQNRVTTAEELLGSRPEKMVIESNAEQKVKSKSKDAFEGEFDGESLGIGVEPVTG